MTVLVWGMCIVTPVFFAASTMAIGSLSQAFKTSDNSLVTGTLVDLQSGTADTIEQAISSRAPQLLGVTANQPLVALGGGNRQAQVVVSGLTPTLVSNINGDIKIGDKITASPIQGIGMKAETSTEIVGTAESSLDKADTTNQQVTDKSGRVTSVKVGLIAVQVNVSYYALQQTKLNDFVPPILVNVAASITGKDLSPLRVLIAFISLTIGFAVVGIMLHAGVRSGIISLGRNPLAGQLLRRSLLDVLATSLGLLCLSIVVFYLILTS